IHHPVSQELFEGLKEAARQNGTSVKTVCFTAYVSMLRMISYESDIVVGLVENNRPICEDGDRMLGCFLNTVPFRMSVMKEGATWETVIQSVNRKLQDLKKYGRLPLFEIVKAIGENPSGQNPIFDAMFNFIDFHVYDQADQMEQYAPEQEQLLEVGGYENTNTLFDFNISTTFDRMTVLLNYQSHILSEEWAERLIGYYFSILHEIVEHPAARIDKGELLAPEERDRLLNVFNATYSVYPREKTIHELFAEQAERTPERTAIVFGDQQMTYRELNERTNQMARKLKRQGVQPDDIVAVIAERSLEMIVGIFSILKAGGAYLPIDPDFPEERIRYMLEDSGASLLLVQSRLKERASKEEAGLSFQLADAVTFSGKVMDLTLDILGENDEEADSPTHFAAESHQLAYVIYTSGSTGKPKGVMIEHHSLVNRLKWMQKRYPLSGTDVILQKTPFTFDVSVWELFWWALEGAQLCLLEPGGEKDPGLIATAIRKHQVTTMHFVPSMMHAFLEYMEMHRETASLSSLKQVFASGEALHVSHVQRFHQLLGQTNGTHLANLYGPTEATIDVTYFDCAPEANWTSVPIGRPIDNTRMYILDEQMRLQPLGVPGELFIAGAGLARGYLNKPELTDERFVADPFSSSGLMYRTGDLGRWLPDGNIEYLGRIDHQVKIRGYRIELGEIETQLLRHEQIIETVVTVQQHETAENASLCAYVVSKTELDPSELRRFLTSQLPSYMIPTHFVYLKNYRLHRTGKSTAKRCRCRMRSKPAMNMFHRETRRKSISPKCGRRFSA
ncbi:non-ribosomal peptide synthetase, partial [Paenibacillus sp. E194]|uniref:non-ribosomal peptide synthetase n=1 Tax=Paenibacillus sp. E194 TaxID=1458845 RepID=UPI000AF89A74